jgi:CPA1 family monovalent cation:H+ antiporter
MENFKVIIFILVVLISLSALVDKLKLPVPVFLVLVGLIIGFVPVLPGVVMDPDVVFLVFLPPLLYDAAFRTSWHEFKTNIKPISALGVSLVFITTLAVAITAHYFIPMFSWPLAFLLGAIISPPDAVAATGIIKGLGLNKQVISILALLMMLPL